MVRPAFCLVLVAALLTITAPAFAADPTDPMAAPTPAVAAAWAHEAEQRGPSAGAFKFVYGSYGALTTLDMISTITARRHGAREINPLLNGSYGQAAAVKAAFAAGTMAGVMALEKKSRKGAFITMVAVNAVTVAVAAKNFQNAGRGR